MCSLACANNSLNMLEFSNILLCSHFKFCQTNYEHILIKRTSMMHIRNTIFTQLIEFSVNSKSILHWVNLKALAILVHWSPQNAGLRLPAQLATTNGTRDQTGDKQHSTLHQLHQCNSIQSLVPTECWPEASSSDCHYKWYQGPDRW